MTTEISSGGSIGPHGYLVLRRYNFDDLPTRFFWDKDDAIEYCDNLDPNDDGDFRSIIDINLSDPASVIVIHFANGKPNSLVYERNLTV